MTRQRKILFAALTPVLLLAATELALRLALPALRTATLPEGRIRQHVDTIGLRFDPDLFWYHHELPIPHLGINEHGFRRAGAMTVKKPAGVTRVITLGDSQTMGAGVKPGQTYSAVAERELGRGWEVLNGAVPGYRSLNVFRLLQREMLRFEPDIVVVDNMPFDSARDDGPVRTAPAGSSFLQRLLWKSQIYYVLRFALEKSRFTRPRWLDRAAGKSTGAVEGFGNHDLIGAWCKAHGIKAVFLSYPALRLPQQVECMTKADELPPDYPRVDACKALRDSGLQATSLFLDRNHLKPAGHTIVGRELARVLRTPPQMPPGPASPR